MFSSCGNPGVIMDDLRRLNSPAVTLPEIKARLFLSILIAGTAILAAAYVVDRYLLHQIAAPSPAVKAWLSFFDLNEDVSIGAWFSMSLWLIAATLAYAVGRQAHWRASASWHWNGLAVLCLFLSLDEGAALHEKVGDTIKEHLQLGGIFHWSWVLYGIALLVFVGLLFGKFLLTLPRRSLWTFLIAGAVFCTGALGFEMYASNVASGDIQFLPWLGWSASVLIEETLEMLGVVIAIGELLRLLHLGANSSRATQAFGDPSRQSAHE